MVHRRLRRARDGRELIVAVLGAPSEPASNAGATALLDWAFAIDSATAAPLTLSA